MIILFFNADLQSVSRKTFQKTNLHDVVHCTANSMNFPGLRLLIRGRKLQCRDEMFMGYS